MAIEIMSLVWKTDLKLVPKMILLVLADFSNAEDGCCWPSFKTLSKKCSISRRPLIGHIKSLCEEGFLKKTNDFHLNGRQRSNYYVLNIDKIKLRIAAIESKKNKQPDRREMLNQGMESAPQTPTRVLHKHPSKGNHHIDPSLGINKAPPQKLSPADARDLFEIIWEVYKQYCSRDKKKALNKFLRMKPDEKLTNTLIAAINKQNLNNVRLKRKGAFVASWPYFARWLENERWLDELSSSSSDPIPANYQPNKYFSDT